MKYPKNYKRQTLLRDDSIQHKFQAYRINNGASPMRAQSKVKPYKAILLKIEK